MISDDLAHYVDELRPSVVFTSWEIASEQKENLSRIKVAFFVANAKSLFQLVVVVEEL